MRLQGRDIADGFPHLVYREAVSCVVDDRHYKSFMSFVIHAGVERAAREEMTDGVETTPTPSGASL